MKLVYVLAVIVCSRGEDTLGDLMSKSSNLGNVVTKLPETLNSVVFQNKCIEDLGCFYTGPPFYDLVYRPVCLPPTDNLMIRFYLFTPTNPEEAEDLDTTEESIEDSSIDPQFSLKVIIHGFRINLEKNDVRYQTKNELLKYGNYNVIIVDWTKNNKPPYSQAVANTRAVGAKLANLLTVIMYVTCLNPQDIHLIGHSLGAHVAGYTGERIPNIGRITGLDPAGPYFLKDEPSVRLDITDAAFVDIIHTNGANIDVDGLGLPDPMGHIDFYPNGGKKQPGCLTTSVNIGTIEDTINDPASLVYCSHLRAYDLFKESIDNSRCRFLAVQCSSYNAFENEECTQQNSTVSEMGFHAKKIHVPIKSKFYLWTNDEEQFCIEDSF